MQALWQDLRYGARMLRKQPGFTLIAVLTISLGIGANTAIFSVVNAVLLRPLPYPRPDEVAQVDTSNASRGWTQSQVSLPDFRDWQAQTQAFAHLAAYSQRSANLSGGAQPERVEYALATATLFDVLATEPLLGRVFLPEEDQPGRGNVVLLSYGFWQRAFGGASGVIGQTMSLNGEICTVVGVMPARAQFPNADVALWKPLAMKRDEAGGRDGRWLEVVGRLKAGVTVAQAQAEMERITGNLARDYPASNAGWSARVSSLHTAQTSELRPSLLMLWGAVGLVLLIACANVANLLLARAAGRGQEIALRSALGASRIRLVRQMLTESLLLALLGGATGVLLALWGVALLPSLDPNGATPRIELDRWALGYSLALAMLTGLLFGLLPALKTARTDLQTALKEGGRASDASPRQRARNLLIAGEVAVTLALLAGAGLLLRSFAALMRVDPGFDTRNVLTLRLAPPQAQRLPGERGGAYFKRLQDERQQVAGFYRALTERVEALPGVQSVGVINRLPLTGANWIVGFNVEGRPSRSRAEQPSAYGRIVDAGLLRTLQTPLLGGRLLAESDTQQAPPVAVINQTMARQHWPNEDAVGKRLRFGDDPEIFDWVTVVGVVGDVRFNNLESAPEATVYLPFTQAIFGHFGDWGMSLVVRAQSNPAALADAIRAQAQALDKTLPVYQIRTLDQLVEQNLAQRRAGMLWLSLFAALALMLAVVGLYGVLSYAVASRTREIGVRLALGAQRRDIARLIIGQGLKPVLAGIALGLGAAYAATRLLQKMLFGVSATDPLTFAAIVLLLIGVALAACWIPARRAAKVDPMIALRCD